MADDGALFIGDLGNHFISCGGYHIDASDIGQMKGTVTDIGRRLLARASAEGLSFQITHFAVGHGGWAIPPTYAENVDASDSVLMYEDFRDTVDGYQQPTPESMAILCRLEPTEGNVAIGEIGVFATIVYSPLVPAEVGNIHLFAIVHTPMQPHPNGHAFLWRFILHG